MKTAQTFYDVNSPIYFRNVEIGDIVEIAGKRAYVVSLGRKYITAIIYGGKRVTVSPFAADVVFTGEVHY